MNKEPFHIGLCLAGAISAGAYTAGVMDFLIEALEDWEMRRGQENVPDHQVVISVIGGASAGGMTGIMTGAAIQNNFPPITSISNVMDRQPQNKFYDSWVDLTQDDMFPLILDPSDIFTKNIKSLLNSSFIDTIAERVVQISPGKYNRSYFAKELKIFTTLSNLEGFSFDITFKSNAANVNKYIIDRHNDYACFFLDGLQSGYKNDGWIPLEFQTKMNTQLAADAAMATGAFPVGLVARRVTRDSQFINDNQWMKAITNRNPIPDATYTSQNVDGGLINNEPFDRVRELLNKITNQINPSDYEDYNKFKSTILMVDPFPSESEKFNSGYGLPTVMSNTLSALIDQARTKPDELVSAMDSNNAAQYLIAPIRDVPQINGAGKIKRQGSKAIACGALGGFGGFLHKEFRVHDYFLGRANCEKFLRNQFTVPASSTNSIIEGYNIVGNQQPYYSATDKPAGLQIIPIFKPADNTKYMPVFSGGSDWPVRVDKDIDRFDTLLRKRTQSILLNLDDWSGMTKFLLWAGAKAVINRKVAEAAIGHIKDSLKEHQLL